MSLPPKKINHIIPENYFNDLQEGILLKLEEEEQFEPTKFPLVYSIDKSKDFYLPENYFKNLELGLTKNQPKLKKLHSFYKYAASIILIIGLSLIFKFTLSDNSTEDINNEIAALDFMSDASYIELEDLDIINLSSVSADLNLSRIQDEDLIEYLLQEFELEDLNNLD